MTPLIDALRRDGLLESAPADLPPVTGVTADSREVKPGMAYIAVRGSQADGHQFVPDAVTKGAAVVVVERRDGAGVPAVVVRDGRLAALTLGRTWYGDPGKRLTLIGITGTNGKTTTTALVRHLFNEHGTAGSIGTLGAFDGSGQPVASTAGSLTTPGPIDLQGTLAALLTRGVTHVAMETSSHSLDQGRLDGLTYAAGIFTNLTRDHLDYHRTMEAYLAAKLRLDGLLGLDGWQIVNADDPAWQALPARSRRMTWGFGASAMVRAEEPVLGNAGSRFTLATPQGRAPISLPLLGEFNIANALAAAAAALALGKSLAHVTERLNQAPQVPGRMERIVERPSVVLRDYAHTPDALERALQSLRPVTPGRLIVVFGCGGERDRGKRPVMGRIAAELADLAIVTSDNPRRESPDFIIDEVEQGMGTTPHRRFTDRREAIAAALAAARPDDTVLLAGKGHETYQVIGTEKVPFDEARIVREILGHG
ncbi:MAG TPA: UDP-N-acetylmuramoyl-L-alanyl-D-glutamate--2,6-diaminopimelate ligase [Gemmatimonadales bacterium]|nr:UDP-N-acetylmuramoyl-L-alanyl-D-glutamate--2,6-diaminopimelate ligase [Gemmatimonadales bacterium]